MTTQLELVTIPDPRRKSIAHRQIQDRITIAFRNLRKHKLIARRNFLCCSGCACAKLHDELEGKPEISGAVYYHCQDADRFKETNKVSIRYSARENGELSTTAIGNIIVAHLVGAGLAIEWSGKPDQVISVTGLG